MYNINKILWLAKEKGITNSYICRRLGVRVNYLAEVKSGKDRINNSRLAAIAQILGTTVEYLTDETDDPGINKKRIPVYGNVAAGIPIEAITDIEDYEDIPNWTDAEYIALRIHGDSMEPRMLEGDTIIVRVQPDVESGDVAVVFVNGGDATCKKIKKTDNGIALISLNAKYEPMFFTNDEIEKLPVRILGKVVELRGKF